MSAINFFLEPYNLLLLCALCLVGLERLHNQKMYFFLIGGISLFVGSIVLKIASLEDDFLTGLSVITTVFLLLVTLRSFILSRPEG